MPKSIAIQGLTPFSSRTLVIAKYTLIEAWRNRFGLLLAGIIVAALLASVFVRQQAITESTRSQIAFLAAALRAGSVFLICIAVIQGSVREIQEKGLEMMLSLDLPRTSYLVGKFIGYALLCLVCAVVVSLPLLMLADFSDVLRWAYTHLLELWIVIAFAILCVTSFSQFASAATLVLAFYVLARSVTAIQLMSQSTIAATGPAAEFTEFLVEFIALVLPRMDAFTQTAWLIDAPVTPLTIPGASLQAAIYVTLLLSAAIFDLHRRNL